MLKFLKKVIKEQNYANEPCHYYSAKLRSEWKDVKDAFEPKRTFISDCAESNDKPDELFSKIESAMYDVADNDRFVKNASIRLSHVDEKVQIEIYYDTFDKKYWGISRSSKDINPPFIEKVLDSLEDIGFLIEKYSVNIISGCQVLLEVTVISKQ